jgi:dephospho-CoA kinase
MIKLDKKKLAQINKRVKAYDANKFSHTKYEENQKVLKKLVDLHGVDAVSAATGLTLKTIQQYYRVSVAPPISTATIDKAETVLKDL